MKVADALGTSKRSRLSGRSPCRARNTGLISASFVVFTLVITDFGIPKVIGGQYNVLATDVYRAVVGQQNFEMGAVVGMILLVPAVLAFLVDRIVNRRQVALLSARAVPYQPAPKTSRDVGFAAYCVIVGFLVAAALGVAVWASFIQYWPLQSDADHGELQFSPLRAGGLEPLLHVAHDGRARIHHWNDCHLHRRLSDREDQRHSPWRAASRIFWPCCRWRFRVWCWGSAMSSSSTRRGTRSNVFYATLTILVVNTITHFFTVSHITALTALKQIDREFEAVSALAQGAVLEHLSAGDGADLPASDPRHRRLSLHQCHDDGVRRDLPLRRAHQARLDFDRSHGRIRFHRRCKRRWPR